jgi:ABC-2 type transport system permease protein
MSLKQLEAKYSGSFLGIFWAIINPLLIMLIVSFIFSQMMKTEIKNFSLFILSALMPWFFFINSICESTTSVKQNADLLRQFMLPREIIPISVVLSNFINFLFGFMLLLPIFVLFNIKIIGYLLLLPLVTCLYFLFTLGISLLFSITNVYFRDLAQLLNVGTMFLFWLTPVFYPLQFIPQKLRWIIVANPVTCYVSIYRSLLYQGSGGGIFMWLLAVAFALLSITSGYLLFIKKEDEVLKYI